MIDALFDLLGTFYQSGNFEQAEWIARSILQAIPDDIVSLQFLGLLYYRTRRRAQAVQVFAAAAGEVPASAAPELVDSSLQASAQCRRAASNRGSTLAGAWYDLGRLLLRLGHRQQAVDALQAAIAAQQRTRRPRRCEPLGGIPNPDVVRHDRRFFRREEKGGRDQRVTIGMGLRPAVAAPG